MNTTWQAISREAAVASEHLAIGVTALGRANYAQHAYYGQAFFALTIGIERSAKLALMIDYFLVHGKFPSNKKIREYGHNLKNLLEKMDEIAPHYNLSDSKDRLPRSTIHDQIIAILSNFATNITRYYNLDLVTGGSGPVSQNDPISEWFKHVALPMIEKHSLNRQMEKLHYKACIVDELMNGNTVALYHSETGENIASPYKSAMQKSITDITTPYVRLYVMQIIRFIGRLLIELGNAAQEKKAEDIPYLADFFGIYNNEDKYFKERKIWSIYRP
ncbi:hypothetical protein [Methanofollis sp. UBA420]|jgi:hypothetical protein|uniref:hypothetical protein n=1 Tax=Methanofollis sp. UBA420 TaxID=1915514 RepID=UPI00316AC6EE